MISTHDCGLSGLDLSPGLGHCVVNLGTALVSRILSACLSPSKCMCIGCSEAGTKVGPDQLGSLI